MLDEIGRFYCKPLFCWLRPEKCAERHVQARDASRVTDDRRRLLPHFDKCQDCNVGAAHAQGLPTPDAFEKIAPVFDVFAKAPPKNFGTGVCPWCKGEFKRLTGNHGFCVRRHAKAYYRRVARLARERRRQRRERMMSLVGKTMHPRPCCKCKEDFTPTKSPFEKKCPRCKGTSFLGTPIVGLMDVPSAPSHAPIEPPMFIKIGDEGNQKRVATPTEILELAGYKVKVLRTPAGELLQVL